MDIFIFNETNLSETNLIDWVTALMPIILSISVVLFTYLQWRLAKKKRQDDLYDKRYRVYDKIREFSKSVVNDRGQWKKHRKLLTEAMCHEFLFNEDVNSFMNKAWGSIMKKSDGLS